MYVHSWPQIFKNSLCLDCKNLSKIFLTTSFSMKLNQSMHNKIWYVEALKIDLCIKEKVLMSLYCFWDGDEAFTWLLLNVVLFSFFPSLLVLCVSHLNWKVIIFFHGFIKLNLCSLSWLYLFLWTFLACWETMFIHRSLLFVIHAIICS
jgi:hypothetical protein